MLKDKNKPIKVCTIIGARPQFIKAAAVSRVFQQSEDIQEVLIHTGQHYDANMSTQFFDQLSIPTPQYHMNIGSGTHGAQTGKMLEGVESILMEEKPDWVLVYGDTNSTLAGALAAAKIHIPIAHIEAGLRSFNRKMPEEINRVTTDHLSTLLFTPTRTAKNHLLQEGIAEKQIIESGDVMYDVLKYYHNLHDDQAILNDLDLSPGSFTLVTVHRAENTDNEIRLSHIVHALIQVSQQQKVVLPLHPRTKASLQKWGLLDSLHQHVQMIDPVGYLEMLALEKNSAFIVTDSGGVQKEAYLNDVPCITLRDETEWIELVEQGWNVLCSPEKEIPLLDIMKQFSHDHPKKDLALYGEGNAAWIIKENLIKNT